MKRHNFEPTDTEGHCYQCTECGLITSIYDIEYDSVIEEECKSINEEEE